MNTEEALDRLYAAPLDEFTATRNTLAKDLAAAGEKDAAGEIKSLKKPNVAAWAINQLARKHPDDLEQLFDVTNKLRATQRRVMSGGRATDLRKATDERNMVVTRLTKLAEKILTGAGHAAAASTLGAISDSFIAVAGDEEGAERLRKGQLSRELEPSPFVDVGGLTLVGSDDADEEPVGSDASAVQEARRQLAEARAALKETREALKKATAEANRLSDEADQAERRAKSAREAAEFARRGADARKADLEDAEKRVEDARRASDAAR